MRLKIIFKIALKNLWSHRLRTILTITGVTIGIASIIFLVSLGYGLEKLVTDQVANFEAFTIIDVPSANISTIKIDQSSIDKIVAFPHVKEVAPVTNLAGRVKRSENSSTAETVITGATADFWKLASMNISTGKLPDTGNGVVVNQAVLNLIGEDKSTVLGKDINLDLIIPAELRENPADGLKVADTVSVKIVGLMDDTSAPIVYVPIELLKSSGATKFTSLKVKVDNKDNIATLRKQLENIGFSTEYVGDTVNEIAQVFSLFRIILAAFGLVALVVAALGTFNTLTISLLEKIKEVGLFKALGMRNKDVYKLFLSESLIIGVLGGIIGLALGWSVGQIVNEILSYLAHKSSAEPISLFLTPWVFAVGIALFSIVVGFLTGWYPSKRAVKIDPLDALRYE